jgi:tetratricopeptide (TPR) repeat protein
VGEQLADPVLLTPATFRVAALAFFEGDWPRARRSLARIEQLPQLHGEFAAGLALELGRLCLAEGAWEQAARYLEQCSAITLHVGTNVHVQERVAQSYLAELDLLQGRPATAQARLHRLLDRGEGVEERDVTTYVLPVLAWAQLEMGETDQAAQVIAQALRRAREAEYRLTLVGALRVQALVALPLDDRSTAAHALDEGLALARALPYPHGEGRLLEVCSQLHLVCGAPAMSRVRLAEAAAVFRRLGARKDLVRVEQALAVLD